MLGETASIARERADYLDSLVDPELTLAAASSNLGADLTKLGTGATLGQLQGNQGIDGSGQLMRQVMRADGVSLTEAVTKRGRDGVLVGTATTSRTACRRYSRRARATVSC